MRVLLITTSRADYGIYQSLLKALYEDPETELGLVVGGTHLSHHHGYTISTIEADGYPIVAKVATVPEDDTAAGVAGMIGTATTAFAKVWAEEADATDWVIALGDRYEMFSAVTATVPFNLRVVHLHGGETSLGAIDDKFRHAITLMSAVHFTATEAYAERVKQLTNNESAIFHVGAPALDGLENMELYSVEELKDLFGTDFSQPTILITFHPETVASDKNAQYGRELCSAIRSLSERYTVVMTMPNADTLGSELRRQYLEMAKDNPYITTIESFGKKGYFSAMLHSVFLLGNTSSGLIEAPSFGKYAINLGARQDGRMRSANVIDAAPEHHAILEAVSIVESAGYIYAGANVYRSKMPAAELILNTLKRLK